VCLPFILVFLVGCTSSTQETQPTTPPVSPSPSATPSVTPEPARWTPIATAPISGRSFGGVVWTGSEMIIWGGVHHSSGGGQQESDGAAYDPSSDSWEKLAPAPAGMLGGGGKASVWDGSEATFWVGNSPDGPVGTAAYDPVAGSWHRLPAGPLGVREGYVSVWTGKQLLIMGGVGGDQLATPIAAALTPGVGTWRLLKRLNALTGFLPYGAVWDGKHAFLYGVTSQCPELGSGCQKYTPTFLSYTPATDSVQPISLHGMPVQQKDMTSMVPVAWTGSGVLFANQSKVSAPIVTYTPVSDAWSQSPPAPCVADPTSVGQVAWAGSILAVPCGKDQLQLYDPRTRAWTVLSDAGRSPLNWLVFSSMVWTGKQLIVWSGDTGGTTPKVGASIDLSAYEHG
jgi:hypothetical protein